MNRESLLAKKLKSCPLYFSGRLSGNSVDFEAVEQIIVVEEPSQSEDKPLYKVVASSLLKDSPEEYTELTRVSSRVRAFDLAENLIRGYCKYYWFSDTDLQWSHPRQKKLNHTRYLERLNHAFRTGEWSGMK